MRVFLCFDKGRDTVKFPLGYIDEKSKGSGYESTMGLTIDVVRS